MERPQLEVADVFRRYGEAFRLKHTGSLSRAQKRVMSAVELCRTAALGGHLEVCDACGHERPAYNSCRNRHCPKCQSLSRARWLEDREAELLPVGYFHLVFTVPQQIAAIAYQNKRVVYGILFSSRHCWWQYEDSRPWSPGFDARVTAGWPVLSIVDTYT